ncbi:uncharacterized protein LOC143283548 [Babylonia areolata]|uniref:uncharacterized protein LOC143283548 n=1 Tax=Babylonia areolata TaxID=304850 RepID=UPI003FD59C77
MYMAVVFSSLLYGCETWTLYRRHIKQLEQFHMRSLGMIMGICRQDKVTIQEVLDKAGFTSIESLLLKAQLRWTGHVIRIDDSCIPLMYCELKEGQHRQGRPKLRYKGTLKSNLRWCDIQPRKLEASAADISSWRSLTSKATAAFEEDTTASRRCEGQTTLGLVHLSPKFRPSLRHM